MKVKITNFEAFDYDGDKEYIKKIEVVGLKNSTVVSDCHSYPIQDFLKALKEEYDYDYKEDDFDCELCGPYTNETYTIDIGGDIFTIEIDDHFGNDKGVQWKDVVKFVADTYGIDLEVIEVDDDELRKDSVYVTEALNYFGIKYSLDIYEENDCVYSVYRISGKECICWVDLKTGNSVGYGSESAYDFLVKHTSIPDKKIADYLSAL